MREKQLEKILKALANRRRLAITAYLKRVSEANVGNIAAEINLSFAATSRHLVILERSGIFDKEQRNKEIFYRITKPTNVFIGNIIAEL
jgi:DNA-binding transcriptional ArsR family regulator